MSFDVDYALPRTQDGFNPSHRLINSSVDSSTKSLSAAAIVFITIAGTVMTVVVVVLIIRCLRKAKMPDINLNHPQFQTFGAFPADSKAGGGETIVRFTDDMAREKPMRFTAQQLALFTGNYMTKLGSGGFGNVYKGQLPDGVLIAVKVLNKSFDKRAEEQLMAEVGTIGRTHHKNLVRLHGFCYDTSLKALVYEYMTNGSLDKYLFDDNLRTTIEWSKLHDIAIGTAKGIAYLHEESQQRITHYDIKPGNVLLDAAFCPKVADFGLAMLCDRLGTHCTSTGMRGTPGYAAPELFTPFPINHKCDVYSFGILLFEILGRRRSLDVRVASESFSREWMPRWAWERFEKGELRQMVDDCGVEEKDKGKAERMCRVALWCLQYLPKDRPSMSAVVRMLEGEAEIVEPTNPFHHLGFESSPMDAAILSGSSDGCTLFADAEESERGLSVCIDSATTRTMRKYEIAMPKTS